MKKSILVPLDGSAESEDILADIHLIAGSEDDVHLLHVIPEMHAPPGLPPIQVLKLTEDMGTHLETLRNRWRQGQPGLDLVRFGDPVEGILGEALEKNIHMIAMMTRGRKGPARLLLGSVASEVVRKSQLPVFLSRPGQTRTPRPIRRILVSLEGAEGPRDLLDTVKALAGGSKAEIILFHAVPPVTDPSPRVAPGISAEHRLQELAEALEKEGYPARSVVTAGPPAKEILEQADRLEVDLIALSTQARTGLERFFQGSVAEDVLRLARVPVLLQKPLVLTKPVPLGKSHG
jgi:nucleotide-binding universal stress UspA family protein